jgi:hypothetical protein
MLLMRFLSGLVFLAGVICSTTLVAEQSNGVYAAGLPAAEFADADCTRTYKYWACHTDQWPQGVDPNAPFCTFVNQYNNFFVCPSCGINGIPTITLIEILNTDDTNKPWYTLAKQWIAAYINAFSIYGPDAFFF